ncbi:serine hydrolase [Polaromonas sp.]|nr:serine hydrolase [Polaromonas sp.]MDP3828111.1 serine hydrolase [Polaromonas sp.]
MQAPLSDQAATVVATPGAEAIGSIRDLYDGALLPDLQVNTLRNVDRLFPTRLVASGTNVHALPVSSRPWPAIRFDDGGQRWDLFDYLSLNRVSGLLVLQAGEVAFEHYALGNTPQTRWTSMSMAKSITATLVGAAIHDGHIGSLDEQVCHYVPTLAGSAYEGVTIRQVLQMSSGVRWNETYTDPLSDRRRLLEAQLSQRPGALLDCMAALPRASPPGSVWNYSTGETQVAGAVLRAAVGRPLSDYLSERIWARFGMEADASWWLESPGGMEVAGSGLSARLRDFARFGLFMLGGGVAGGTQILPQGWIEEASSGKAVNGSVVPYGYMWWPMEDSAGAVHQGAYLAIGIFGQYLYIHPAKQVVIAQWSAMPKPKGTVPVQPASFFAAVVQALGRSSSSGRPPEETSDCYQINS